MSAATAPLQAAFDVIGDAVGRHELPSAALAIADGDQLLRSECFQPADGSYEVREDSQFLIASVTKTITAAAVMRLVARGVVRLTDPVTAFVPEFAANAMGEVNLWHLLTHTSGVDERFAAVLRAQLAPAKRYLVEACNAPRRFEPGSCFSYCNEGYRLLAEVASRACDKPYVEVLHDEVFAPLGMTDTSFAPLAEPRRLVPVVEPADFSYAYYASLQTPGGGLHATTADLVRFGQAMLRGLRGDVAWLGPAALDVMTRLHTDGLVDVGFTPPVQAYYGVGVSKTGCSRRMPAGADLTTPGGFGHAGATGSLLWIEPDFDLVFVLLTNRWGVDTSSRRDRALNAAIAAMPRRR